LRFRRLAVDEMGALLEVELQTGRMHQVRVQSGSRGWPVRGDELYGSRLPFGPPGATGHDRAIALHARTLVFLHPIRFEPITVTAPLPDYWPVSLPGACPAPSR
jgi:23S rRNA-/tRNA-specific pseudouridylate synthase